MQSVLVGSSYCQAQQSYARLRVDYGRMGQPKANKNPVLCVLREAYQEWSDPGEGALFGCFLPASWLDQDR